MTSPNPMALEAKALEAAAERMAESIDSRYLSQGGVPDVQPKYDRLADYQKANLRSDASAAIRAYLAALPPPAAGEGLEPQAQVMALIQEALALAPDAGLYLKIEVGAAK